MVSCTFFSAKSASASMSSTSMATFSHFASVAVPALPGATKTFSTRLSCATFQARACSRPPLPMINTFISFSRWGRACGPRWISRALSTLRCLAFPVEWRPKPSTSGSMAEVTHSRKDHRNSGFVGRIDDFRIAHRATRLDHGGDADGGGVVQAVAEREEGIGGHYGTLNLQTGVFGLDCGDAGGVDAAHLPGTHAHGLAVLGIDDGVGLDELGHFPGEDQVMDFLLARRALGHDLEVGFGDHADVAALHQQAAVDALVVQAIDALGRPLAALQQANVGLGGDHSTSVGGNAWGDDHFDELTLDDSLSGGTVQLAVEGDDAAERRLAVGGIGQVI